VQWRWVIKVLVAGSNGLVGRSIIRKSPSDVELLTPNRKALDLENSEKVNEFIAGELPDAIILAAAKVGGIESNSKSQYEYLLRNLAIQNSVIEAAMKNRIPNFLFLGSSCVYPKLADQPIREDSLLTSPLERTNEGYALAKIAGIKLCNSIYEEYGLNYFSLMPTNLYGPYDNFDVLTSHVPAALLRRFHEAKIGKFSSVNIWGSGNAFREFMHVDDLADACWYFLGKPVIGGELINIGTGRDSSIKHFAETVSNIVGFEGNLVFDTSKPEGTPRKLLDIRKASELGWQSKIPLEIGLSNTYDWFREAYEKGEVRGV
jgi:GDP-L-fucose synthase